MTSRPPPPRPSTPTFGCRRALLLQGPMGPFFRRFREELLAGGVSVWKVNFNAGDALFDRGSHVIPFRDSVAAWPDFFEALVRKHQVDTVFVFGDGRVYHRLALERAQQLGVRFFAFEEGYLRPGFVTLEQGGVNARSPLPRSPHPYLHTLEHHESFRPSPVPEGKPSFWHAAWYSTLYSLAMTWANRGYPHYQHHRPLHAFNETIAWLRAGARKLIYQQTEADILPDLISRWSGRFFLVPLQVYCDYQLKNAPFESMDELMEAVSRSFAAHAPPDAALVFKHHPLDRGYTNYEPLIQHLGRELDLSKRLFYIHDQHLPTLLKHARGCVTLNSTTGMEAIKYGTPLLALGKAVYCLDGLVSSQPLDVFWQAPEPADPVLFRAFRAWLTYHNQVRGNFYRRYPNARSATTFDWPPGIWELEGRPRHPDPCNGGLAEEGSG